MLHFKEPGFAVVAAES